MCACQNAMGGGDAVSDEPLDLEEQSAKGLANAIQEFVTTERVREGVLSDAVDGEIPAVFAALPMPPATPPMPPAGEFADVLAALDTYRKTSPEMVVFGRMIGDALPAPEGRES